MAHMDNANPTDDEELDNHPGAFIIRFGKYAGKQLDSIPTGYRLWATGAECQRLHWYADFKEANDRYEEQLLQTPEAYTLSFGKHENKRLDEVPEDYIWSVIRPSFSNHTWYQSLVKAHRRYLDKVYQNKSPGSVYIWFGRRYRGYTLSLVYKRCGFIKFCLKPEHSIFKWYHKFEDLVRRYEAHLATHRRPHRGRKPANVQNPVGDLLGSWDDRGSVDPGDDYVRDGFVVDDGEGEDEDEDSQEEGSGSESDNSDDDRGFDDDFQGEEVYDDSEVNTANDLDGSSPQTERPSRASVGVSEASESESDSDSDDDTPLDELPNKIRANRVFGKRKAEVVSSPSPQRSHQCEFQGSDDDIAAQPPRKRRKGPRLVRDRPAQNDFHSGAEPIASTSHLDEQESPHQLSHSGSSQESAASSSTADESQIEDESSQSDNEELSDDGYDIPPSLLGSYYRSFPRVITGSYRQEML
ncbi:hypothetical protein EV702DRAFT_1196920 [Suillus placidus]|uniref:Uncharacterized protein n=1 Tax=Suillus placidus TaxID=48579 RepID=A0A9P6ZVR9_9AGAM|nr:hypothetical protein EV702DRAFT_1196920 [Suillus placidus]